ncbi:TetR/AcrR family transcriptional regulator [Brucella sp. 22210]|uniref:TetR/AcrR family transcriptional regulator n=1 Tax=Brucella sp. 22210 TaxID=3453892 RepID=UPI003F85C029
MLGKRALNKQKKYYDFLAAATKLFTAKGVENTTMQEIAEKAGAVTKTLNRYFPTKNLLISALITEEERLSFKRVEIKFNNKIKNFEDYITDLIDAYFDYDNIINNVYVRREFEAAKICNYRANHINMSFNPPSDIISFISKALDKGINNSFLINEAPIFNLRNSIHAIALLNYHRALAGLFSARIEALETLKSDISFVIAPFSKVAVRR